jgi:hypothetical protein
MYVLCIYVHVCVYIHIYMYVYIHDMQEMQVALCMILKALHVFMYVYICGCLRVYTYFHINVCMYVHVPSLPHVYFVYVQPDD